MIAAPALLTIGNELLDGRIVDTNATMMQRLLIEYGLASVACLSCRDSIEEIVEGIQFLAKQADLILISGGLGPTTDDLTREALSAYLDSPLIVHEDVLEAIKQRYQRRGRAFDPSNTKQATLPKAASVLANQHGTAPGFKVLHEGVSIFCFPGVPRELEKMLQEHLVPHLNKEVFKTPKRKLLRVFGRPESQVNTLVGQCKLPNNIVIGYQASFPEIKVVLSGPSQEQVDAATKKVREMLGEENIFSDSDSKSLPQSVHELLLVKHKTLGLAESCTGGLIGAALTDFPGSSQYLMGGVVSYSNQAKKDFLQVQEETLRNFGAVSDETAQEMAKGVLSKFNVDYALSVTGIAGPDGGSDEKPVGLFFIGLAHAKGSSSYRFFFPNTRDMVRRFACACAMDVLRRELLGLEIKDQRS